MIGALIFLAQLHCAPNASGNVDCWDAQKGGAPVLKVEPNLFGGYDLRQIDGKLVRCEKKASGETECRVVQKGRPVTLAGWQTNYSRMLIATCTQ